MNIITTKTQAKALFGDQAGIARALGISPQAVHRYPEQLTQRQGDAITGAAVRLGMIKEVNAA